MSAVASASWKLCLRSTFIDVDEAAPAAEGSNCRRRAASEGCLRRESGAETEDAAYVHELSAKLSAVTGAQSLGSFFGAYVATKEKTESISDVTSVTTATDLSPITDTASETSSQTCFDFSHAQVGYDVFTSYMWAPWQWQTTMEATSFVPETANTQVNSSIATMLMQAKAETIMESCSVGSVGHPELCNRPCLRIATGNCELGAACDYCHLAHSRRPVHLDKRHRELLRELSPQEFLAVVLPILGERVASIDSSPVTEKLLATLSARCTECFGPVQTSSVPSRNRRTLATTLRSMSLKTLASTLHRTLQTHTSTCAEPIDELLQHLRRSVSSR